MRAVLLAAMAALAGSATFADDPPAPPTAPASAQSAHLTPEQRAELVKALDATRMLLEFKRGEITLTPEQVQQYKATLRAYTAAHGKFRKGSPPTMVMRDMPLKALAAGYRTYSGKPVTITDRAGAKIVSLEANGSTYPAVVAQIDRALQAQGFIVTHADSGTTIDFR